MLYVLLFCFSFSFPIVRIVFKRMFFYVSEQKTPSNFLEASFHKGMVLLAMNKPHEG